MCHFGASPEGTLSPNNHVYILQVCNRNRILQKLCYILWQKIESNDPEADVETGNSLVRLYYKRY